MLHNTPARPGNHFVPKPPTRKRLTATLLAFAVFGAGFFVVDHSEAAAPCDVLIRQANEALAYYAEDVDFGAYNGHAVKERHIARVLLARCAPTTTTSTTGSTTTTVGPTTTTTVATTTTTVPPTTTTTTPPTGTALWHGDADIDVDRGDQTNCMGKDARDGGQLTIGTDPLGVHGDVYRAQVVGSTPRAEWDRAYRDCDGDTEVNLWGEGGPGTTDVYIGWRSQFTGNYALSNSTNDGNVVQWKGNSSCGGPAVGMTIRNNRLSLRTIDGNIEDGGVEGLWNDSALFTSRMNDWTDFVMRVNFSKTSSGFIEMWIDGVKQTMANGTQRYNGPTVCPNDSRVIPKFGVYSLNSGANAVHWLEDPKIGTSYGAVVPR